MFREIWSPQSDIFASYLAFSGDRCPKNLIKTTSCNLRAAHFGAWQERSKPQERGIFMALFNIQ